MILCNFTYLLINYPTGVYDSCWFIFSRRRYVFAKGPLTYWTRNLSFLYVVFQWNWIFLDFGSLLSSPCPCHFLITILCKGIFKYSQILNSNEFFILNRNNLTHKKLKRIILLPFPHVLHSTGIKTWTFEWIQYIPWSWMSLPCIVPLKYRRLQSFWCTSAYTGFCFYSHITISHNTG